MAAPRLKGHHTLQTSTVSSSSAGGESAPALSSHTPEAETAPRVEIVTMNVAADVTTPPLQSLDGARAADPGQPATRRPRAKGARPGATPRDNLSRRLARIIAGDGRYEVRPFPTVPQR